MDLQGVKSTDMSVGDLLKDFYTVPDYQREYVWESAEVEKLLGDVANEFNEGNRQPLDYFIGTIVTNYKADKNVYELIDGQQRVTTLYVILISLRDYLIEMGAPIKAIDSQLSDWSVDRQGKEVARHRVVLQYEDSQGVLDDLVKNRSEKGIDEIPTSTRSAYNLVQAYQDSRAFLIEELGGNIDKIKKFYAYLSQNVKLIRIKTESIDRALWIFETINARGKGLDAMDLLKNLLFRHAKSDQFEKLKQRWKSLIDALYSAGEKPIGFIRYYLLAYHAKEKIQADKLYGWITDPQNRERPDYWTDPLAFTNSLLAAARAYVNFSNGKLEDGSYCRPLSNMWYLSHTARQHLILMLAARGLPKSSQELLAEEIEKLYFVFLITKQPSNLFELEFIKWAGKLRVMKEEKELKDFLENTLIPRRHKLGDQFNYLIRSLVEGDLPKYRLKYILGKFAQYLDELAIGARELEVYVNPRVDIEHILPLEMTEEWIDEFGSKEEAEKAVHKLANLTLLERSHNASISNKPFAEKQEVYAQSNFILTKGLSGVARVGNETKVNKALSMAGHYSKWDKEALLRREDALVQMAGKIWGMPIMMPMVGEDNATH